MRSSRPAPLQLASSAFARPSTFSSTMSPLSATAASFAFVDADRLPLLSPAPSPMTPGAVVKPRTGKRVTFVPRRSLSPVDEAEDEPDLGEAAERDAELSFASCSSSSASTSTSTSSVVVPTLVTPPIPRPAWNPRRVAAFPVSCHEAHDTIYLSVPGSNDETDERTGSMTSLVNLSPFLAEFPIPPPSASVIFSSSSCSFPASARISMHPSPISSESDFSAEADEYEDEYEYEEGCYYSCTSASTSASGLSFPVSPSSTSFFTPNTTEFDAEAEEEEDDALAEIPIFPVAHDTEEEEQLPTDAFMHPRAAPSPPCTSSSAAFPLADATPALDLEISVEDARNAIDCMYEDDVANVASTGTSPSPLPSTSTPASASTSTLPPAERERSQKQRPLRKPELTFPSSKYTGNNYTYFSRAPVPPTPSAMSPTTPFTPLFSPASASFPSSSTGTARRPRTAPSPSSSSRFPSASASTSTSMSPSASTSSSSSTRPLPTHRPKTADSSDKSALAGFTEPSTKAAALLGIGAPPRSAVVERSEFEHSDDEESSKRHRLMHLGSGLRKHKDASGSTSSRAGQPSPVPNEKSVKWLTGIMRSSSSASHASSHSHRSSTSMGENAREQRSRGPSSSSMQTSASGQSGRTSRSGLSDGSRTSTSSRTSSRSGTSRASTRSLPQRGAIPLELFIRS